MTNRTCTNLLTAILAALSPLAMAEEAKVKVMEPAFVGDIPEGWEIVPNKSAAPVIKKISLKDGSEKSVELTPYYLVPKSDGKTIFAVKDPAYQKRGSAYQPTLEAAIEKQNQALLETERELGESLELLKQLLLTLPPTEEEGETE